MGLAGHSLSPLRLGQDGTGERWVCINKAPVASGGEGLAVQYPADLAWEGITCHVLDQRTLKMKQARPLQPHAHARAAAPRATLSRRRACSLGAGAPEQPAVRRAARRRQALCAARALAVWGRVRVRLRPVPPELAHGVAALRAWQAPQRARSGLEWKRGTAGLQPRFARRCCTHARARRCPASAWRCWDRAEQVCSPAAASRLALGACERERLRDASAVMVVHNSSGLTAQKAAYERVCSVGRARC